MFDLGRSHAGVRADQAYQPVDRHRVVGEDRRLAAGHRHAKRRPAPAQGDQRLLGLFRHARLKPASGQRQAQSRLDLLDVGAGFQQPLQGERPGQRPAVVKMVESEQKRGLIAGAGMKELPRNLGQGGHVASLQRLFQHPPGTRAVLQLIKLASLAGHLADQPLGLGFQAAMDGRAAVGLIEEVFRFFQNRAQAADGLAEATFGQQFLGIAQFLERTAVGRQKDVLGQIGLRRLIRRPVYHSEAGNGWPHHGPLAPGGNRCCQYQRDNQQYPPLRGFPFCGIPSHSVFSCSLHNCLRQRLLRRRTDRKFPSESVVSGKLRHIYCATTYPR